MPSALLVPSLEWAFGAVLLVLFLAALKLVKPTTRILLVSSVLSVLAAGYLAEGWFRIKATRRRVAAEVAGRLGRPADSRGVRQVIADYRARGTRAYPCCAGPWNFEDRGKSTDDRGVLPLTMGSHEFVVFCNESGTYLTYETDEHGFHNPSGTWSRSPMQVVLLGDSYTHGMCVPEDAHFVQPVRARYPATLNLGIRGSGPLVMLAAFKEYAAAVRPQRLLWVFYENDFDDLREEERLPRLMAYVGKPYRQSLLDRQPEIDALVTADLDRRIGAATDGEARENVLEFFKFTYLRLNLRGRRLRTPEESEYRLFHSILREVNSTMEQWGGKLSLVYLPDISHFTRGPRTDHPVLAAMRRRVLEVAAAENIPVIDVTQPFQAHPNPLSLYFYNGSHYTEEGYGIVGRMIVEALSRADGQ